MKNKIIIVVVGLILISNILSVSSIAEHQIKKDMKKISEEKIESFFTFTKDIGDIEIFPSTKNLIKQVTLTNGGSPYIPGIHQYIPCDPIDINGIGALSEEGSDLMVFLAEGNAALNNTFNDEFVEWEIAGIFFLLNFEGEWSGSGTSSDPLEITGKSEQAILVEWSFFLEMTTKNPKYERGNNIPLKLSRFVFIFMQPGTIYLKNPHFYMYYQGGFGESTMIYDEIIPETWEITKLGSKTWNWDQKDYEGMQVPDGNYSFSGECEINNRLHPVFGPYIEIVEELSRNIKTPRNRFISIIERYPLSFPVLRFLFELK